MNWDFDVAILEDKYIFRFPRSADSQEKLKMEIGLLKYLNKKISLAIPNYLYVAKDLSFAGYNLINGVSVSKERHSKLSTKEKVFMAKQLAYFLNDLHSIPLGIARKCGVVEENDLEEYENFKAEVVKYLFPKLKKQEIEDVKNFLEILKEIYPIKKKVLAHGDLARNNFLMINGKVSGIIDFSDMTINDPALDFNDLWDYGEDFVKSVYAKYKNKDKNLIYRSKLYYKKNCLRLMIIALKYDLS
ncbi:MAG: aminoglycoside phosphotransferase family protein, partial [Candidatus Moranbacteria bacterium]|nr:aminoglycoside phosphotransferase family protein [Candidatus Moranbacteria bacterium]